MRGLCSPEWKPTEVLLSRSRPHNLTPYRNFFRASLSFDAGQNAISFPSRWLDHQIPNADPLLHNYLEREAKELHAVRNSNLTGELRLLLRKALLSRKCKTTDIARQLCIHERTLHRKLREEGTSFQHELNDTRYRMAQQLLAENTMPLAKIATILNYTDASTFNRAFKRWAGITPAQWRTRNGSSQ
jgi:AraC-like DNA-binding protein